MSAEAGAVVASAAPASVSTEPNADLAYSHVRKLAEEIGVRASGTDQEHAAATYIGDTLRSYGYEVELQRFPVETFISRTVSLNVESPEQRRLDVDMLVGVRLMWTETDLTLRRDDGLTLRAKPDDMWMDPIAGVRGIYQLSPHWSITAYGDVGSGASDLTWQAYGAANYQVNDCVRLLAGWRHLKDDFDDDGFVYDVTMAGPMLGASFSF